MASRARYPVNGQTWAKPACKATYDVILRSPLKLRLTLFAPESQNLLETPPCLHPQVAPLCRATGPFACNQLVYAINTCLRKTCRTRSSDLLAQHLPTDSARRHVELDIPWVIDQLEDGMRRVVALTVAELVNPCVPSRTVCVARRKGLEDLGREPRFEQESVGPLVSWQVALLAHGNDLTGTCEAQKA